SSPRWLITRISPKINSSQSKQFLILSRYGLKSFIRC
ncbi:putative primosome assembly protein PriA, partial [Vibrio parahaemolyticus V-223/04]